MINKVHIIGASGSGKSTLAKEIATLLGTTATDLDYVAYEGGMGGWKRSPHNIVRRLQDIDSIIKKDVWVTEGIYLWWTQKLFENADLVIWLDVPYYKVAWRVIKRHYQRSKVGDNRYKGIIRLIVFLGWILRYYIYPFDKEAVYPYETVYPSRKETEKALTEIHYFRCKSDKDIDLAKDYIRRKNNETKS